MSGLMSIPPPGFVKIHSEVFVYFIQHSSSPLIIFHNLPSVLQQQYNPLIFIFFPVSVSSPPPPPPSSYLCPHSLETAKSTAQAATMASPVDLNMAFTQPNSPAASPTPTLATMGALTPAHMLGSPYGAMPLSGLLGVKSVPFLTLSSPAPNTAAPSHTALAAYTAKISSANCIKKPERQKFAPYWCSPLRLSGPQRRRTKDGRAVFFHKRLM